MTRKQLENYPNIPDHIKERLLRTSAQMKAEEALRNNAIAEWLGWYEEPIGIWYIKDSDVERDLVYNEWKKDAEAGLPFSWDMNYLTAVYDKLCKSVRRMDEAMKNRGADRKEGEYCFERWFITNKEFVCWLVQWKNGRWRDADDKEERIPEIYIKIGEDVLDFTTGLFMFTSQIILTITDRLNELK